MLMYLLITVTEMFVAVYNTNIFYIVNLNQIKMMMMMSVYTIFLYNKLHFVRHLVV